MRQLDKDGKYPGPIYHATEVDYQYFDEYVCTFIFESRITEHAVLVSMSPENAKGLAKGLLYGKKGHADVRVMLEIQNILDHMPAYDPDEDTCMVNTAWIQSLECALKEWSREKEDQE